MFTEGQGCSVVSASPLVCWQQQLQQTPSQIRSFTIEIAISQFGLRLVPTAIKDCLQVSDPVLCTEVKALMLARHVREAVNHEMVYVLDQREAPTSSNYHFQ